MRPADNPFRTTRTDALAYRWPGFTFASLDAAFARADRRASIVGPHGSGKTTLLDGFAQYLDTQGWRVHRVALARPGPGPKLLDPWRWCRDLGPGDVLFCDSAGVLGPAGLFQLRLAARSLGGLLVTLHEPGSLPVLHTCAPSPEVFAQLLDELGRPVAMEEAVVLLDRHRGDVRAALRALYDKAARSEHPA
jgi:hypothetical protein